MRAVLWTKYGAPDGLILKEIDKPTPKDHEVLIRVHATSVFAGDAEMRALKFPFYFKLPIRLFFGLRQPRGNAILGQELSGEIEEVGKDVTLYQPGDRVYAAMGFDMGAYAEYKVMPEHPSDAVLAPKPANMSYEEAATIPVGGLNALHFLRKATIKKDHTVLINGAGGSIGIIAIQLAKYYGAEVTVVDSGEKLEVLQSLGADHVIDYTKEDFGKSRKRYDVVFDVVGRNASNNPFFRVYRSVKKKGHLLLANPKLRQVILGKLTTLFGSKRVIAGTTSYRNQDLIHLKELIEKNVIRTHIDRQYTLEQIVEAHAYVDTGKKTGNVAITVVSEKATREEEE